MASPYSSTAVSGYNTSPPPDDGTFVTANQITWAGIKTKLGDPLNTFASAVNTSLVNAFAASIDGSSPNVQSGADYNVLSTDQGKQIKMGSNNKIITPDATVVGVPFMFMATNNGTGGNITLMGHGSQNIDGSNTQTLANNKTCIIFTDGANWWSIGR